MSRCTTAAIFLAGPSYSIIISDHGLSNNWEMKAHVGGTNGCDLGTLIHSFQILTCPGLVIHQNMSLMQQSD